MTTLGETPARLVVAYGGAGGLLIESAILLVILAAFAVVWLRLRRPAGNEDGIPEETPEDAADG